MRNNPARDASHESGNVHNRCNPKAPVRAGRKTILNLSLATFHVYLFEKNRAPVLSFDYKSQQGRT